MRRCGRRTQRPSRVWCLSRLRGPDERPSFGRLKTSRFRHLPDPVCGVFAGGSSRLHRLVSLVSGLGPERHVPTHSREREVWRASGAALQRCNSMLDRIIDEGLITACGVYGTVPANAVGDDVELYTTRRARRCCNVCTSCASRRIVKAEPCRSLADFIAPKETGLADYIGGFAVTSRAFFRRRALVFSSGPFFSSSRMRLPSFNS